MDNHQPFQVFANIQACSVLNSKRPYIKIVLKKRLYLHPQLSFVLVAPGWNGKRLPKPRSAAAKPGF
jgi:hypothetical protein